MAPHPTYVFKHALVQDASYGTEKTTSSSRMPITCRNAMAFPMSVGATTILLSQRPTPEAVFETMSRHRPTVAAYLRVGKQHGEERRRAEKLFAARRVRPQ